MKTLLFISKKYWMGNKVQLLQLCAVIILAVAALFGACLYGRSSLLAELEEMLDGSGNYDLIVSYPNDKIAEYLEADSRLAQTAKVYRVGSIGPIGEETALADVGYFENQAAIDMFHLPLITGRYPERQGELCADQQTLQSWGYSASTGQKITLAVYDKNGEYIGDREYLITGIIKLIINNGFGARTYRTTYLNGWSGFTAATPPLLYFSAEEGEALAEEGGFDYIFLGNIVYTGEYDETTIKKELSEKFQGKIYLGETAGARSSVAFGFIIRDNFMASTRGLYRPGFSTTERVAAEGTYLQMNFYNGFLIPCFTALLVLLTVCSIYSVLHLTLQKRSRQFGILRSVGMSMGQMITMLLMEAGSILIVCIGLGYLLGAGIYGLSLKLQEVLFDQKVFYAFSMDEFWGRYIRMVTYDPALLPWLTVVLTLAAVLAIYFVKNLSKNPLAMLRRERSERKKKKRVRSIGTSLMGGRHVGLALLLAIVVGAVSFGYLSCRIQADEDATDAYDLLLYNVGVEGYEYAALLNFMNTMIGDCNQMLHQSGLDWEGSLALVSDEAVGEYVLYAYNYSSKLVYEQGSEKEAFLMKVSCRYKEDPDKSAEDNEYLVEEDRIAWEYRGFEASEGIYQVPSLGLAADNLSLLAPYVVEGEIHPEKLLSGEEVILLARKDSVCDYFSVGEILPLADVVFNPEIDENEQILQGIVPPGFSYFGLGDRKDFPVRLGAIVVMDEEAGEAFYPSSWRYDCDIRIVTTLEAMQVFGLPDRNYTNLYVSLKPGANRTAFEEEFYTLVARAINVTDYNLVDIWGNITASTRAAMLIFYGMFSLLAVIGAVSVYNLVTVILYNSGKKIAILRAVGGNRKQIRWIILKKSVWYPLIAGLLGASVIYAYTGISWYAQNLIWKDGRPIGNGQYPPDWYWHFPIQAFWDYAPHRILLGITALIALTLLLFVVKQLRSLLHREIPGELYRE